MAGRFVNFSEILWDGSESYKLIWGSSFSVFIDIKEVLTGLSKDHGALQDTVTKIEVSINNNSLLNAKIDSVKGNFDSLKNVLDAKIDSLSKETKALATVCKNTNDSLVVIKGEISKTSIPQGAIIMWSGAISDIPTGWGLCNGENGKPDLRGRFIVGAGSSYEVDSIGGAETHDHTVPYTGWGQSPAEDRPDTQSSGYLLTTGVNGWAIFATNEQKTNQGDSKPPFYALAFIIKL